MGSGNVQAAARSGLERGGKLRRAYFRVLFVWADMRRIRSLTIFGPALRLSRLPSGEICPNLYVAHCYSYYASPLASAGMARPISVFRSLGRRVHLKKGGSFARSVVALEWFFLLLCCTPAGLARFYFFFLYGIFTYAIGFYCFFLPFSVCFL